MTEEQGAQLLAALSAIQAQTDQLQAHHDALLLALNWCFVTLCAVLFFVIVKALRAW